MIIENLPFIKALQKFSYIDRIILYGSRARGTYQKTSDIDIAVECPLATDKQWLDVWYLIEDQLDTLLGVDCVRYDELSHDSDFKKAIDRDGKIIFKRKK